MSLNLASSLNQIRTRLMNVLEPPPPPRDPDERRRFFAERQGDRYWWHRHIKDAYLPDVYRILSDSEWDVLKGWFEDSDAKNLVGECTVPLMSWLTSFVNGNGTARVLQLGTYAGYSTLLLGWALQRAGKRHALMAVDIDPHSSDFAASWVRRAGLDEQVRFHLGDSADPSLPARVSEYLGGPPQLVFIDSSHQYAHSLRELALWYDALPAGGIIAMHDTSAFASTFDSTGEGGVRRAFDEWRASSESNGFNLAFPQSILDKWEQVYLDGCGLGLVIKDK